VLAAGNQVSRLMGIPPRESSTALIGITSISGPLRTAKQIILQKYIIYENK
jgi:hypothetical protein